MKLLKSKALDSLKTSARTLLGDDENKNNNIYTMGKCAGKLVGIGDLEAEAAKSFLEKVFAEDCKRYEDADAGYANMYRGYDNGIVEVESVEIVDIDIGLDNRTDIFNQIHNDYDVIRNALSGAVEVDGDEVSQSTFNTMWMDYDYKIPMQKIQSALDNKYIPLYNPVMAVYNKYKDECTGSIDQFMSYVDSPDQFNVFFKKWYINMVALGITNEPMNNPLMICLVGGQGVGKTELFRHLLPRELSRYMSDERLRLDSEHYEQSLIRHLIVLNDEMDQIGPKEMDALKRLLTLRHITYRPLYSNTRINAIRRGSMCGSGNSREVLNDATGNRRMVPLEIECVHWEEQAKVCRGKMVAEAVQIINEGYTLHLDMSEVKLLNNGMADKFEVFDAESELLLKYFSPGDWDDKTTKTQYWPASDIITQLERHSKIRVYAHKFSAKLQKHGFGVSKNKVVNGVQLKRYAVKLNLHKSKYE